MSRIILLDSGPLGLLTSPPGKPGPARPLTVPAGWQAGWVLVPEIAGYETRRGLVRAKTARSVGRLDALASVVGHLAITTTVMRHAAHLWATAGDDTTDADMILCAQALGVGYAAVVATTTVGHLGRLTPAAHWSAPV